MKFFRFACFIYSIVMLGLLTPIVVQGHAMGGLRYRTKQIAQRVQKGPERALARITGTIQSGKQATIRRLEREYEIVETGIKAALKKIKRKSLTEDEKKDLRSFEIRAGALISLIILTAAATGGAIWWKRRAQAAEDTPGMPVDIGVVSIPGTKSTPERLRDDIGWIIVGSFGIPIETIDLGRYNAFEDRFEIDRSNLLFGIYDGHGGFAAAQYLKQNLIDAIRRNLSSPDPKTVINQAFRNVYERFMQLERNDTTFHQFLQANLAQQQRTRSIHYKLIPLEKNVPVGLPVAGSPTLKGLNAGAESTAIVALIKNNTLYIANLGDSDAVLVKKDGQESLTQGVQYHGASHGERAAFGTSKPSPVPYIINHELTDNDQALILASDGIWDFINADEASQIVRAAGSAQEAATDLQQTALNKGSEDDITVIVLKFRAR